ncbi:hypothetical protein Phou_014880 [Phytohabitans houttuyneae]|uniref:Uncharacterized protein n=1 Tax=Phytohabitans houttuyneae TaxID=1076126 RepID=A0A6V8K4R4_9ACTN|nr:hypothetical protein Phou_014880 [Phytohabitans houttuyneae]
MPGTAAAAAAGGATIAKTAIARTASRDISLLPMVLPLPFTVHARPPLAGNTKVAPPSGKIRIIGFGESARRRRT